VAYEAGCEFVDESFGQHLTRVAQRPVTRVGLCIGKPREASELGDRETMAAVMQTEVQALVHRARAAMG
jgi:hypothetical protein